MQVARGLLQPPDGEVVVSEAQTGGLCLRQHAPSHSCLHARVGGKHLHVGLQHACVRPRLNVVVKLVTALAQVFEVDAVVAVVVKVVSVQDVVFKAGTQRVGKPVHAS